MSSVATCFLDPDNSAITAMRRSLADAGCATDVSVDLRREPTGMADLVAMLPGDMKDGMRRGVRQLLDDLASADIAASTYTKGKKISVRFTDRYLSHLERLNRARGPLDAASRRLASGRKIFVDFCDPNANKALHVGHIRNIALGHAIARSWSVAGASVISQSVICDFGRNIAETIAGYESLPAPEDRLTTLKSDHFVGQCYAAYASTAHDRSGSDIDAPISREVVRQDDVAEAKMIRWLAGDCRLRSIASRLVRLALDGHQQTFERLGVRFDRFLFESRSLDGIESLLKRLELAGSLATTVDGAVVFLTGRDDYPHLLLRRPDGFPTEHLRAAVLWDDIRDEVNTCHAFVHIIGNEWLASTEVRESLLRQIGDWRGEASYRKVPHAMVLVNNSKMKSRDGLSTLADSVFEMILANRQITGLRDSLSRPISDSEILRLMLFARFLTHRTEEDIDFDVADTFEPGRNAGLMIIRALGQPADPPELHGISDAARYAILQADRLSTFFDHILINNRVTTLARQLERVANWCLQARPDRHAICAAQHFLLTGSRLIGLVD